MVCRSAQEGSLNCVTAGYFARVVGTLLFRRTADIMRYLESHQAVRGAPSLFRFDMLIVTGSSVGAGHHSARMRDHCASSTVTGADCPC